MAYVRDAEWLLRFRTGSEIIIPGSALECLVDYEYGYGDKGELVTHKHTIAKVSRIIGGNESQERLPGA